MGMGGRRGIFVWTRFVVEKQLFFELSFSVFALVADRSFCFFLG